jgi:hypothetical protein
LLGADADPNSLFRNCSDGKGLSTDLTYRLLVASVCRHECHVVRQQVLSPKRHMDSMSLLAHDSCILFEA